MVVFVVGIDTEIKTKYPYLIIHNGDDFINVTSDGKHTMNDVVLGSFYDVFVNYTESHVDAGFSCSPFEETGTADLPCVKVVFVCDYTSNQKSSHFKLNNLVLIIIFKFVHFF